MYLEDCPAWPLARTGSQFLLQGLETSPRRSLLVWDGGEQRLWGPEEPTAASPQCRAGGGGGRSASAGQRRSTDGGFFLLRPMTLVLSISRQVRQGPHLLATSEAVQPVPRDPGFL